MAEARGRLAELPEVLTVEQVAAYLGLSRAAGYEAVRRGDIPSLAVGRRRIVLKAAFQQFLQRGMGGAAREESVGG